MANCPIVSRMQKRTRASRHRARTLALPPNGGYYADPGGSADGGHSGLKHRPVVHPLEWHSANCRLHCPVRRQRLVLSTRQNVAPTTGAPRCPAVRVGRPARRHGRWRGPRGTATAGCRAPRLPRSSLGPPDSRSVLKADRDCVCDAPPSPHRSQSGRRMCPTWQGSLGTIRGARCAGHG